MADIALSAPSASPLAGLLALTPPDPAAAGATAADPFAALLAGATGQALPTPAPSPLPINALPALLATTAATPIAPKLPVAPPASALPLPVAMPTAALPASPLSAKRNPDADGAILTVGSDMDEEGDSSEQGKDPLADAIASGATAVLALAPAIMTPIQAPAPTVMDAPVSPPVASNNGASTLSAVTAASTDVIRLRTPVQTQQAPVRQDGTAQAQQQVAFAPDDAASDHPGAAPQQAPEQAAAPAPIKLPDHVLKAVMAQLADRDPASDTGRTAPSAILTVSDNPSDTAPAKASTPPGVATPPQAQHPAVAQSVIRANPVKPASDRRGDDEVAAARPATRKSAGPAAADPVPASLPQSAVQATAPSTDRSIGTVEAKGDTVVQDTLSIARDGAWLDRLARDIAHSAGSGNDLHFKLSPQNLGALSVSISQKDDGASIRLTADTEATRNILLDAQPSLIAEARAHGLTVSETHVDLSQNQNQGQNQGQNQPQSQNQNASQSANQDASRWAQGNAGQNAAQQNGQNRQSSPDHQPFVSNLGRKKAAESESGDPDSSALYA